MNDIAIVIPCFNRTDTLQSLLESLDCARYSIRVDLIFSIDFSGNDDVYNLASGFKWKYGEKEIITHPQNIGLRRNVLFCGDLTQKYNAVIVLEDDLIVSPLFFDYAIRAYDFYKDNERIAGISLYAYRYSEDRRPFNPIIKGYSNYFVQWTSSWGQMWTKNQWKAFRLWYNKYADSIGSTHIPDFVKSWKESWKKFNIAYIVETDKYYVYPIEAFSTPRPATGIHSGREVCYTPFNVPLCEERYSDYIFQSFNEGIKYDCFFELCDFSLKIDKQDSKVDFNIFGEKKMINLKHNYYITACKLSGVTPLNTWGLVEIPIEKNIINNRSGDKLFLYKTDDFQEVRLSLEEKQRLNLQLTSKELFLSSFWGYYRRIKHAFFKIVKSKMHFS